MVQTVAQLLTANRTTPRILLNLLAEASRGLQQLWLFDRKMLLRCKTIQNGLICADTLPSCRKARQSAKVFDTAVFCPTDALGMPCLSGMVRTNRIRSIMRLVSN
jgi:hypothetical protein